MADNTSTHSSFEAPGTPVANDTAYEYRKIEYIAEDKEIIRALARTYMEYASLPLQQETAKLWTDLNDLKRVRPLVWHNEHMSHEDGIADEVPNLLLDACSGTRRCSAYHYHFFKSRTAVLCMVITMKYSGPVFGADQ